MKPNRWLVPLVVIFAFTGSAFAGLVGLQLNTSVPGASLGGYSLVPFLANGTPAGVPVSAVDLPAGADPTGSVSFSTALTHFTVGSGWGTWSHGYTGEVYWLDELADGNAVTLTLPSSTKAFYFYVEPGFFGTYAFDLQASASDGSVWNLSTSIAGMGGASGFGLYTTGAGDVAITSISIAGLDTWPDGFALGEFGINGRAPQPVTGVPDAGNTAMLLAPLALVLALWRRVHSR